MPYLAGSGVKGVMRRAGEEFARDGEAGANELVKVLFGHEDASDARRGALTCWDVFPNPDAGHLSVEIMTPHYGEYYQRKGSPHDTGKPNPVTFRAVPPGAAFRFIFVCEPNLLGNAVREEWQDQVQRNTIHAFDWLGFGAKTALGYGAMSGLSQEESARRQQESESTALRCSWMDDTLRVLVTKNRAQESDTLRGRGLADAWSSLTDPNLKSRVLADIRARWRANGWWDSPPPGAARKAKAIYEGAD